MKRRKFLQLSTMAGISSALPAFGKVDWGVNSDLIIDNEPDRDDPLLKNHTVGFFDICDHTCDYKAYMRVLGMGLTGSSFVQSVFNNGIPYAIPQFNLVSNVKNTGSTSLNNEVDIGFIIASIGDFIYLRSDIEEAANTFSITYLYLIDDGEIGRIEPMYGQFDYALKDWYAAPHRVVIMDQLEQTTHYARNIYYSIKSIVLTVMSHGFIGVDLADVRATVDNVTNGIIYHEVFSGDALHNVTISNMIQSYAHNMTSIENTRNLFLSVSGFHSMNIGVFDSVCTSAKEIFSDNLPTVVVAANICPDMQDQIAIDVHAYS